MKKVAILTAAGSGMGADAAKKLSEDGFKVGILSSSGKGEKLAKKLGGIGFTGSNQNITDLKKDRGDLWLEDDLLKIKMHSHLLTVCSSQ